MKLQAFVPTWKNEVDSNRLSGITSWKRQKSLKFPEQLNQVPIKNKNTHTQKKVEKFVWFFFFLLILASIPSSVQHSLNYWEEAIQLHVSPSKWKERIGASLQCLACLGLHEGFISVLPDVEFRQE